MGIDHIQMPLCNGQINGLTNRTTRMMQAREHIDELYKITKIFNFCITSLTIKVAHKRRSVDRGKNSIITANLNITLRITGILGKMTWGCLTKLARKPAREPDTLSFNITANPLQNFQRFWIISEINANFFEHYFSGLFNGFGRLIS